MTTRAETFIAAVLAMVLVNGTGTRSQPAAPLVFPADFPPSDSRIWTLLENGLRTKAAKASLGKAPDSAETFELLVKARQTADALTVLRRITNNRLDQLALALRIAPELAAELSRNDVRDQADQLRELLPTLKSRIARLPREDEARAARDLVSVDSDLGRRGSGTWAERLDGFVAEYRGTDAALVAQVEAISARPLNPARLVELEAFAREHPGTCAAAKALFQRGFDLAHNNSSLRIEPNRGDPLERFMMVDEVVKELESGRYGQCEPVQRAAELIVGFFVYQPSYASGSVERMLAVYEAFVRSHFVVDDRAPTANGIGYLITSKMADLYALQGDRTGGVERLLADLARDPAKAPAARYLLAEFYRTRHAAGDDRRPRIAKARETLAALHESAAGAYARKALATLAILEFDESRYQDAVTHLTAYLAQYPSSPWAWVAALRLGYAYAALGDWTAAVSTFRSAATRFDSVPPARVLAHEYAARGYEALGRFSDARTEHERALALWDDDYGPKYSLFFTRPSKPEEPFAIVRDDVEIAKTTLVTRVADLKRTLAASGAALLERGRWLFARGQHDEAITVLTQALQEHAASPIAGEARYLLHRARLTRAVERRDGAELESVSQEPFDFWVAAAQLARGAMLWKDGGTEAAQSLGKTALDRWLDQQRRDGRDTPPTALERDVLEIRNLMFRPRGDGLFAGTRWELQSLEPPPTPFFVARQAIVVKVHGGATASVRVDRPIPDFPNVLFWGDEQLAFFDLLLARIGGTERGAPTAIMQIPNQPVGGSLQVLEFLKSLFPARPGHWGGWMIETFPMITHLEFTDAAHTKAAVRFTVGYEGATAILEKKDGVWTFKEMTSRWIT